MPLATVEVVDVTAEHYSDRIVTTRHSPDSPTRWEFDSVGLARTVSGSRIALGWSTRELARRARISQSYVVALERPGSMPGEGGPTPTLDVVARLAAAIGIDVHQLVSAGLRPVGRHVLLVVDDHTVPTLERARGAATSVDRWLVAARDRQDSAVEHQLIDLRRDRRQRYEHGAIEESLRAELALLQPSVRGEQLGLIFAETSDVMSSLVDPTPVLSFEERWSDVVTGAADDLGAHAAWNVCVYEMAALSALGDPLAATMHLMRTHDTLWSGRGADTAVGATAARRILRELRPAGSSPGVWRQAVEELITELPCAA